MPSPAGRDLVLAIDFGTTATAAAIGEAGRQPSMVDINNEDRMPSMVFWRAPDDEQPGELLLGKAADAWAASAPECLEPTPKRSIGLRSLQLGEAEILVTDVIAAILRKVTVAAIEQSGGIEPTAVYLTHPARWYEEGDEIQQLRDAARRAGLPDPVFMSEPEAAAVYFASERLTVGQCVAVYDFGGGTFDTAVLKRTGAGFELVGQPGGDEHLGGEDFDDRLYEFLGSQLTPEQWERLRSSEAGSSFHPESNFLAQRGDEARAWSRANREVRREARRAKEHLSGNPQCPIYIPPPVDQNMLVNQDQLRRLIADDVEASVEELARTVRRAGLEPRELAAVYLAGGSSQIPLVQALISEKLAGAPMPQKLGNAKTVVARGAATAALGRLSPRSRSGDTTPPDPKPDPKPEPKLQKQKSDEFKAAVRASTSRALASEAKRLVAIGRALDRSLNSASAWAQARRRELTSEATAADAPVPQRLMAGALLLGLALWFAVSLVVLLIVSIPVVGAITYSRRQTGIEGSASPGLGGGGGMRAEPTEPSAPATDPPPDPPRDWPAPRV